MSNIERLYYVLQENDCNHWFKDNADTLSLAKYLDKKGCIAPPCKVGDTVYVINVKYKTLEDEENNIPDHSIEEAVVTGIKYQPASKLLPTSFYIFTSKNPLIPLPLNSETETNIYGAFFSYEEAERALKGGVE